LGKTRPTTSARLPNEKHAQLAAMAQKTGQDNISQLIQVALLGFIERHDGMDANDFAKLKQWF
jgi:hypothetical protein